MLTGITKKAKNAKRLEALNAPSVAVWIPVVISGDQEAFDIDVHDLRTERKNVCEMVKRMKPTRLPEKKKQRDYPP
jgi:hypothetical protein